MHTLRHSFAIHLLEFGTDIRIIQQLLGHSLIKAEQIYPQVSSSKISEKKARWIHCKISLPYQKFLQNILKLANVTHPALLSRLLG